MLAMRDHQILNDRNDNGLVVQVRGRRQLNRAAEATVDLLIMKGVLNLAALRTKLRTRLIDVVGRSPAPAADLVIPPSDNEFQVRFQRRKILDSSVGLISEDIEHNVFSGSPGGQHHREMVEPPALVVQIGVAVAFGPGDLAIENYLPVCRLDLDMSILTVF